ncbi:MAG TPA: PBP1A family penicillin-binding protein [Thermoanaerobaculia bacterium]|jgi:penicillin-binding protein 1B|nr:PBP1A family penicillin-binding protein [Thermoanaerobaculia bacterium]
MDPARRRLVIAGLLASALLFLGGFALSGYLWSVSRQFPEAPFPQPSRLYGSATLVTPGASLSPEEMIEELKDAGYREAGPKAPLRTLPPGTFHRDGDRVAVHLRRFLTPGGPAGGVQVTAAFRGSRVAGVEVAGRPAKNATLEPPLLASFYNDDVEERRPVSLAELPEPVVQAVLAAEDSGFYQHAGVSPSGITRALWTNLRGGELQQGGSTITQQLVKNLYLSSRRTLTRKGKEAVIAVMLEARYSKEAILEAYLNEIYLGRSGPANLIGLGAAARAYFGKDVSELSLAEAATLAGMIQAPGDYSPVAHPQAALARRNWVLQRMADLGWIRPEQLRAAAGQPVTAHPQKVEPKLLAPYFAEAARAEARERFDIGELGGKGYRLFSTLRRRDQRQAEAAVGWGLAGLEGGGKRRVKKPLQAALISMDPRDGSILAWVGGRDYRRSQFDRVVQAHRQAGSAFKPVVYAAAFADGVATPVTLFRDSPIVVRFGKASWQPQNYDAAFHGWVTARTALEQSLNIPTVRMALQVGLHRVAELARDLGLSGRLEPRPSLALGAFEVSPLEMASMYAAFAAGGVRPPLHGLAAVVDPKGEPVLGDDLPVPFRVLPPEAAYQVTTMLQGAVDHGTAAGARSQGLAGRPAGKTGTTNDRRDNWFAGYSPDRVSVVWVGYDDNSPTRLSGARAALPIWSRFTAAVRPPGGYLDFAPPPNMVTVTVDPLTGQLATDACPYQVTEVLAEWQAPTEPCLHHSPGFEGEAWADLSLGQPWLDPRTGRPLDPAATEEPRYTITEDGLQITDPGGEGTIVIGQAQTFPPHPVNIPPHEAVEAGTAAGSTILIRPANSRPPAPAAASQPAVVPPAPVVVPTNGKPIGASEPAKPAEEEETPPPP